MLFHYVLPMCGRLMQRRRQKKLSRLLFACSLACFALLFDAYSVASTAYTTTTATTMLATTSYSWQVFILLRFSCFPLFYILQTFFLIQSTKFLHIFFKFYYKLLLLNFLITKLTKVAFLPIIQRLKAILLFIQSCRYLCVLNFL